MRSVLLIISLVLCLKAFAGEGLWNMENCTIIYPVLKEQGLSLSQNELYNEDSVSIKDAVARFGEGGSCSFVSDQGLVLTNYHLALSFVKQNSTVVNNYLTSGFCAEAAEKELRCNGLYLKLQVRAIDITGEVCRELQNNTPYSEITRNLVKRLTPQEAGMRGEIQSLFSGYKYVFYLYRIIDDIRLVYVPPYEIAKFGDEELNWMWPRWSADFAFFRAYSKDAKGISVPFRPAKRLNFSTKGIAQGDFVMTVGFPGGASSGMTSAYTEKLTFPSDRDRVELMKQRLQVMKHFMDRNDSVQLQMITLYSALSNDMKKREGIVEGGSKNHCIDLLRNRESACLTALQSGQDSLYRQYTNQLHLLDSLSTCAAQYMQSYDYYREGVMSMGLLQMAFTIHSALVKKKNLASLAPILGRMSENFNSDIDKELFCRQLNLIQKKGVKCLPASIQSAKDITAWADRLYSQSILTNKVKLIEMISSASSQVGSDLAVQFIASIDSLINRDCLSKLTPLAEQINTLTQQIEYTFALTGIARWPSANGTLRLSYGNVSEGTFFTVPHRKLRELYAKHEINIHWNSFNNAKQAINFISNCHTSGGNSGSPVLDNKGDLVGLNFDRKQEGLSGDFMYNASICRNIMVDSRYILTLLKADNKSSYLLDELNIVR